MYRELEKKYFFRLVNHGPVVLVTSSFRESVDVTPIAWCMPLSDEPALVALSIWPEHFIFYCIRKSREFVLNIPHSFMRAAVVGCGATSGRTVNKFRRYHLSKEPSRCVGAPRVCGCLGYIECRLAAKRNYSSRYPMLVIARVVYVEVEDNFFHTHWIFSSKKAKTLHHLGGNVFSVPSGRLLR